MTYTRTVSEGITTITQTNEAGKNITAFAAQTGGLQVTIPAHGYAKGDVIQLKGTALAGGYEIISIPDANNFMIERKQGAIIPLTAPFGTAERGNNDLSGLGGTTGITTSEYTKLESGGGTLKFTLHELAGTKLIISGVQKIATNEELVFENNAPSRALHVSASGSLILGQTETRVSDILRPEWTPLRYTNASGGTDTDTDADLYVEGEFIQHGGLISAARTMGFASASKIRLIFGAIVGTRDKVTPDNTGDDSTRIRQRSTSLSFEHNYRVYGSLRFDFFQPPVQAVGFEPGYTTKGGFQALSTAMSGGSDDLFLFRDFDAAGVTYAGDAFGKARVVFRNLKLEGELLVTHNSVTPGTSTPVTKVEKEINFDIRDLAGSAIQNVRFYIKDYDNGSRLTTPAGWRTGSNEGFNSDREYSGVTQADGTIPNTQVILTRALREGLSPEGSYNGPLEGRNWAGSGTTIIDYRSKNNTFDDAFDIDLWSYGHLYQRLNGVQLRGGGILEIPAVLLPDTSVSESNVNTVAGYTSKFATSDATVTPMTITITADATLDELYDYLKYLKTKWTNNADKWIVRPASDRYLGTAEGSKLSLGTSTYLVNVTVNAGVTLSKGSKFTHISTYGRAAGDGTYDAAVTDDRGSVFTVETNNSEAWVKFIRVASDGTITDEAPARVDTNMQARTNVSAGDTVHITVKAPGTLPAWRTIDTDSALTADIDLVDDSHVDTGTTISDILGDDVEDTLEISYVKHGKAVITVGDNLSNELPKTIHAIDYLLTTAAGINYLANYPRTSPQISYRQAAADFTLDSAYNDVIGITFMRNYLYIIQQNSQTNFILAKVALDGTSQYETTIATAAADRLIGIANENGRLYISSFDQQLTEYRDTGSGFEATGESWNIGEAATGLFFVKQRPYTYEGGTNATAELTRFSATDYSDDDEGYSHQVEDTQATPQAYKSATWDGDAIVFLDSHVDRIRRRTLEAPTTAVTDSSWDFALDASNDNPLCLCYGAGILYVVQYRVMGEGCKVYAYRYKDVENLIGAGFHPYQFTAKTIKLNREYMTFEKKSTFALQTTAKLGIAAYDQNGNNYEAPFYFPGGRVLFSDLSEIVVLTSDEAANAATAVASDTNFTNPFKNILVDAVFGANPASYTAASTFGKLFNDVPLNVWKQSDLDEPATFPLNTAGNRLTRLTAEYIQNAIYDKDNRQKQAANTFGGLFNNIDTVLNNRLPQNVATYLNDVLRTNLTQARIENLDHLADSTDPAALTKLDAIKAVVDRLRFTSNDVHATLDGETVTTDDASDITAIKSKTDNLPANTANELTAIQGKTNQIPSDFNTAFGILAGNALFVRKILRNNYAINRTANPPTLTIYDDDGTTALVTFNLLREGGNDTGRTKTAGG